MVTVNKTSPFDFSLSVPNHAAEDIFVSAALQEFCKNLNEVLTDDYACLSRCDEKQVFLMENMVSSPEYFRDTIWPNIAPDIVPSEEYLSRVFATKADNRHAASTMTEKEIIEAWPPLLRLTFERLLNESVNGDLLKLYDRFGYQIPI